MHPHRPLRGGIPAAPAATVLALLFLTLSAPGASAQSVGQLEPPASVGPNRPLVDTTEPPSGDPADGALAGRPRVRARRVDTPPVIDGRLDDAAWLEAALLTDFVQQAPLDGAPATERTEIYIAYDSDHLYFGFYLHYSNPDILRATRVDRDTAFQDDLMTVYLDTFMDQQRSYDFDVNAYNVQGDGVINASNLRGGPIPPADRSWDALFHSGAEIVDDGYTAEMAIPFKSIRYPQQPPGVEHRWGFQIAREVKGKDQENIVWAPMSRDVQSFMAQMGVLEGMTDLSTSRNLEILPTFTAIQYSELDAGSGAWVNRGAKPEGGVNLKYGITSNLTADFTVHPDFSQIESDQPQIDVNQRFPLFFSELRPFFLEGQEIFQFTSPVQLVHTRTIVDPNFGAKLTGKVGRTTLGVLFADDEAPGKRDDASHPAFGQTAQFMMGRARYDLYRESHIGVVATSRQFMDGFSRVGGVDGQFRVGRASRFNFVAVQSRHRDEDGAERSGPMLGALFRHEGRHLQAVGYTYDIYPGFHTDVGFDPRRDQRVVAADVDYRWWPEHWIINWGPSVDYMLGYNHAGIREDASTAIGLDFRFARNVSLNLSGAEAFERYGGVGFQRTNYDVSVNMTTTRRLALRGRFGWGDEIFYDPDNPYLGRGATARISATVRPSPRLTSQVSLDTSRFTDVRPGPTAGEVFNVQIVRALSTFTFTDRLLIRNITEYNSHHGTLGVNLLATYRINALTVFYVGYDDHYQQADLIEDHRFPYATLKRKNRAVFTKLQYLFRY